MSATETINSTATLLNISPEVAVSQYRDAAYAATYQLAQNRVEVLSFVRAALSKRHPELKGMPQMRLAIEVMEQEGLW